MSREGLLASVQELKDAVVEERLKAIELADRSFQAIDTITNQANFWLTVLSVGLAIIALVGLGVIYLGTRRLTKKVADSRMETYIESDEGKRFLKRTIEEELKKQMDRKVFVTVQPNAIEDQSSFPVDPNKSEANK